MSQVGRQVYPGVGPFASPTPDIDTKQKGEHYMLAMSSRNHLPNTQATRIAKIALVSKQRWVDGLNQRHLDFVSTAKRAHRTFVWGHEFYFVDVIFVSFTAGSSKHYISADRLPLLLLCVMNESHS